MNDYSQLKRYALRAQVESRGRKAQSASDVHNSMRQMLGLPAGELNLSASQPVRKCPPGMEEMPNGKFGYRINEPGHVCPMWLDPKAFRAFERGEWTP